MESIDGWRRRRELYPFGRTNPSPNAGRRSKRSRARSKSAPRPRLRALRWLGFERILGPVVARIAAAHVLAHVDICVTPEAREVASHLQRPVRRGQQLERDRNAAAADLRRFGKTEHLLH